MYYVGLDIHQRSTSVEILDSNGKRFKRFELKAPWPELAPRLAQQTPKPFAVCYEASCGYGYLYEQFSTVAHSVKAAHPGQLSLIFNAKRKNNRVDASKLAKLLYLDAVPPVHIPPRDVRLWRQLIEFRQKLLRNLVVVKNQIRASLRAEGLQPPRGLWTRRGTLWLKQLQLSDAAALRRDLLIEQLAEFKHKLKRVDSGLKTLSEPKPAVALLRTIPGIGPRTAEALVAYIDDPRRFSSVRQVGSYFGWDPCQDASGPANRLGHITRDGPSTVRKLLVEASWVAIGKSPTVRAFYERVMHNDPGRSKIAVVATAHYLTRVALAMLKSGETWREDPTAVRGQANKDLRIKETTNPETTNSGGAILG